MIEVNRKGGSCEIFQKLCGYGGGRIFCAVLMCIAVTAKQQLITILCIMAIILSGFEHSIADFPYLLACLTPEMFLKYVVILLGNMAGAIVIHMLLEMSFGREDEIFRQKEAGILEGCAEKRDKNSKYWE